ncbi:hypothetical protein [Mycobacterium sp.]|uniref:hypothetical protein n=1 Tax=Mycobacterium sp. TaxID=1785 RepID=UPI003D0B4FF1
MAATAGWTSVRHGDAFLAAGSSTTAIFTEAVRNVRQEFADHGRDRARFPIGKPRLPDGRRRPARARKSPAAEVIPQLSRSGPILHCPT